MSQLRDISGKIRAAIAIVAVWALMFNVAASNAAIANPANLVFKNNAQASAGLFACFKRHVTQRADAAGGKAPGSNHAGKHRCPCCLAASAAAAVLPERVAAAAGRIPVPKPVHYFVAGGAAPKNNSSRYAHGARAPPPA
ncbi:hypothetical protein [Methylocystis parvus]|uniref:DUF2946 domain-containing protein n=1 Tax=Methylocystis parvus TaxID=134 RepID=A0A6B8M3F0_9HYPH|nr:hypothetical protein [Methylocystis parvus]QGM96886.1 hypothetical protein F7D14_04950 [Methylocystis parvus]WBJ99232.1 hypothetical protein MMG94_14670 [Methylocystis parvus OBBP]